MRTVLPCVLLIHLAGCSGASSNPAPADAGTPSGDSGTASDSGAQREAGPGGDGGDQRDARYCEILLGAISGSNVHVQVYSTEGLNDCPESQWSQITAAAIMSATGSTVALLNGPRYWTLDSLAGSSLLDPTPRDLGGILMRQAGAIDLPVASAMGLQKPYTQHTIQRMSVFTWWAGKAVFELVAADGHVYTMQSYSTQKVATQSEATLPSLGSSLMPPSGWSFRVRTLTSDLVATATNGTAVVVQDDDGNTYLQTQ